MATRGARPILNGCIASLLVMAAHSTVQGETRDRQSVAVSTPFTWNMAGTLVKADTPLQGSASTLLNNHFSYIAQYAMNTCQNNNTPYSCAANGCAYPGNPNSEIPSYTALRDWMVSYRDAGLYVGLWGATVNNPEAEAHCMAEVANTLNSTYGVTPTFFIVDAEKSYETNFGYTKRFVDEFNRTITFPLFKAETPECHTVIDFAYWINNGFTSIQPQAYWNDNGWDPKSCLEWSLAYGVPKSQCQVMLDGYRHGTPITWDQYAAKIAAFGGSGFNIWMTLNSDEWDQWKSLIETNNLAVYDGSPSGGCSNECGSGQKRCLDGDAWQECGNWDSDACLEWGGWWSCAQSYPGTTCSNGYCVGSCSNECSSGQKRCLDGDAWEECGNYDADACLEWGGWWSCSQSYPGTTCSGGYCVASCSNECSSGQKRCLDGDAWQECGNWDGDACLEFGGWWSCGQSYPGTTCSGGYCVGGGGCSNECSPGQKRCLDGDAWQECGNWDGDSCLEFGGWWSCAQSYPGTHCSSGYCVN
jgi:hypothetical protein